MLFPILGSLNPGDKDAQNAALISQFPTLHLTPTPEILKMADIFEIIRQFNI